MLWWSKTTIAFEIRCGHDHMVVGYKATRVINAYHYWRCEFETRSWRALLDTTLCDEVCQWLATARCFSPVIPDSSTNKDDRHDINEILWKVALSTIKKTKPNPVDKCIFFPRVNIHSITIGFFRMCIENIWKWLF
jgi:hypothetical protein